MFDFHAILKQRFAALRSDASFFSLRHVKRTHQHLSVRRNVAQPLSLGQDEGVMITVRLAGVEAYAATHDLSQHGLQTALERAEAEHGSTADYLIAHGLDPRDLDRLRARLLG